MNQGLLAAALAFAHACAWSAGEQSGSRTQETARVAGGASPAVAQAGSLQTLEQASDRLREAVRAIGRRKPGPERDHAIEQANAALSNTEGEMAALLQARGGADASAPALAVVLLPIAQASDDKLGSGCWVRFYDDRDFRGRNLTLVGPVEVPKIHEPGGLWIKWSSAIVGPNATVTTFDYEQFKNRTAVLKPGQRIPDLSDKKLGVFEDIHSARVACKG